MELKVGNSKANTGDNVKVPITLENLFESINIKKFSFDINFDPSSFEIINVDAGEIIEEEFIFDNLTSIDNNEGKINLEYSSEYRCDYIKNNGVLAYIEVKVKEKAGEYPFEFVNVYLYDENSDIINVLATENDVNIE